MLEYPKGSEWRKWDLHVHSLNTHLKNDFAGNSEEDFVKKVLDEKIHVVGLTNYFNFKDKDYILKKKLEDNGVIVFLNLEIRLAYQNKEDDCCDAHIVFDNSLTKKDIDNFLTKLNVGVESGEKIAQDLNTKDDFNSATVEFDHLVSVLTQESLDLKGKYLIGFLSRGKGNGRTSTNYAKITRKSHFLIHSSDKSKNVEEDREFWLSKGKPLLQSSDSHDLASIGSKFSWIKADTTFKGFLQILEEPEDRISLSTKPEKLKQIELSATNYIDKIKVTRKPSSKDPWFEFDMPINPGLVAVIGRKGSGKSAFVDIIALSGNSHTSPENYSFLTDAKFRKNKTESKLYTSELDWCGGPSLVTTLDKNVDINIDTERVKYLPQKYVEKICNDDGVSDVFQKEINSVIFKYVPDSEREGTTSLDELKEKRTGGIDAQIKKKRSEIEEANKSISILEEKKTSEYKEQVENKLTDKRNALSSLKAPDEVKEPGDKLSKEDEQRLAKLQTEKEDIKTKIQSALDEKQTINESLGFLNRLESEADSAIETVEQVVAQNKDEAKKLGIDLNKDIKANFSKVTVNAKRLKLKERLEVIDELLGEKDPDSSKNLYSKQNTNEANISKITKTFKEERKAYHAYLETKTQYEQRKANINGKKGDKSFDTIVSLEEHIKYLSEELDNDLKKSYEQREKLVKELYVCVHKKIDEFEKIYSPLIDFIKKDSRDTQLTFNADVNFDKTKFTDEFLGFVNQSRDGSFQGKEDGKKILRGIIQQNSFSSAKGVVSFISEVLEALNKDVTEREKDVDIKKQINLKYSLVDVYNYLYKLEYLDVEFNVLFNGKDLNTNEFSPGEKGALLLIFYLLIDKSEIPLIIDQPEENLDNESVYSVLVPHIKDVKKKRQIIIVTHNPNLAVVCDAEQIICAEMDKKKNVITYKSGSIEEEGVNNKIVDVLEGTMPAFSKRDKKYLKSG